MRGLIPRREARTLTDSLFNDFFNEMMNFSFPSLLTESKKSKFAYPKMNIRDVGDGILIEAAVPGLTEDNVEVEFSDGLLSIKGSSQNTKQDDGNGYLVRELHKSSFVRSIRIDPAIHDVENIEAEVNNGTLNIKIPLLVVEQKAIKRIPVKGVDTS